ncbi:MAG: CPBP family intramembrane glutamic endopeptidase [bacterium]
MLGGPRRAYLVLEFITLFIGLPVMVAIGLSEAHLLIVPVLLFAAALCLALLLRDPSFDRSHVWNVSGLKNDLPRLAVMLACTTLLLVATVMLTAAESFMDLPLNHPVIWLLILLFYPVISVPPQELIYRVFLFHRYRELLTSPAMRIAASALVFCLAHLVFANILALILTLGGGLLFAYTYHRTQSLAAVSLEHALYGCLAFTVGIGNCLLYGTRLMMETLAGMA